MGLVKFFRKDFFRALSRSLHKPKIIAATYEFASALRSAGTIVPPIDSLASLGISVKLQQ
ncbi:hypothetical protein PanWU01x14_344870, partial [Parasponia andersonii]